MNAYEKLEQHFETLAYLEHCQAILGWDEAVMMPVGGGGVRAKSLALLSGITHQKLIAPQVNDWLEQAKQTTNNLNTWQQANLQWMERFYINASALSTQLVQHLTEAKCQSEQAWRIYREKNDWISFLPFLQKTFDLVKESASIRAAVRKMSTYDLMIDDYSPGITQALIEPVFTELKNTLPELINNILQRQSQQPSIKLQGSFSSIKQKALGIKLMEVIGFDFNHGRLDTSHHPFCGGDPEDVRITTRYNKQSFISALMGICHETGHACYEQGLPQQWLRQPVGRIHSMALHESQSLLIEMQACRSREFMTYLAPLIQTAFGSQAALSESNLYRLYTEVSRGLIRVDADEVTYPLHIILRYELEKQLVAGNLMIADLPQAWDEYMQRYLGLTTLNDVKNGVMQDVHWPSGAFGYFPAYTIGSLTAAQLFAAAKKTMPHILFALGQGDFSGLLAWLRENVHWKASSVTFDQLLKEATGESLNAHYFITHVKNKYAC